MDSLFPGKEEWHDTVKDVMGYGETAEIPHSPLWEDMFRIAILSDDYGTTRKFAEVLPKYTEDERYKIGTQTWIALLCNDIETANKQLDALSHADVDSLGVHFSGDDLKTIRGIIINESIYFDDGKPEDGWNPEENVGSVVYVATHDYIKGVIEKFSGKLREEVIKSIFNSAGYEICGPSIVAESFDQESVHQLIENYSGNLLERIFEELSIWTPDDVDPEETDRMAKILNSQKVLGLRDRYKGDALNAVLATIIDVVFNRDPDSGPKVADVLYEDYLDPNAEPGFSNALIVAEKTVGNKDAVRRIYEISPEIGADLEAEWRKGFSHGGLDEKDFSLYHLCKKTETLEGDDLKAEMESFVAWSRELVEKNDNVHKKRFDEMKRKSEEDESLEKYPISA